MRQGINQNFVTFYFRKSFNCKRKILATINFYKPTSPHMFWTTKSPSSPCPRLSSASVPSLPTMVLPSLHLETATSPGQTPMQWSFHLDPVPGLGFGFLLEDLCTTEHPVTTMVQREHGLVQAPCCSYRKWIVFNYERFSFIKIHKKFKCQNKDDKDQSPTMLLQCDGI